MDSGQPPPPRPPPHLHLSPRRELQLQGPRPSPLRVSKDSHKIKKPPPAPPPPPPPPGPLAGPSLASGPIAGPSLDSREPVIIYTISPKIIHVEASDFMDLVQRLTGPHTPPPPPPPESSSAAEGILSPAAKFAAIHRTIHSPGADRPAADALDDLEMGCGPQPDRSVSIPGILSPAPASFPPISPAFFSPSYLDSSFLHELSPAALQQLGRHSPGGGNFWNGFGNFLSPSVVPSPAAAAWDLFNHFQDF